jgi:hypothetical protein
MCTVIVGRDVVSPASVLLWANRDEDPSRPTDPPGVLRENPRLVGGRDRRSGGSWLAVRETRAVVALLNRRPSPGGPPPADLRSRGLLVLDVASATVGAGAPPVPALAGAGPLPRAAWDVARQSAREHRYGPCTLLFAAPKACWLMAIESDHEPRFEAIPTGWHVITHADLDDPGEPRTAALLTRLAGFRPRSVAEAEARLDDLLRSHGDETGLPPVCLHEGRMVTVSASTVWLTDSEARYRHAEGRPCEHPFVDRSSLLSREPAAAD